MRINCNCLVYGKNVVLVPYRKHHVPKYHEWMKSVELQQLTASEALSLEQEYEMQQSWLVDDNKCTFIILEKHVLEEKGDEIEAMIGDTNLFMQTSESPLRVAEVEIMIAEKGFQGKRRGWEAMALMLKYGCDTLQIEKYTAKIGMDNMKSISMFTKLGFEEVGRSVVFQEVTLEKCVTEDWKNWLSHETRGSKVQSDANAQGERNEHQ